MFHGLETHVLAHLDVTVLYIIFKSFEIYQILPQNPNLWVYQKNMFVVKIGQNYLFLGCDTHILAQLDVTVIYIFLRCFKRYQISC
jgi:hypothetical protein